SLEEFNDHDYPFDRAPNTFYVQITASNVPFGLGGEALGVADVVEVDSLGKPYYSEIELDDDGAGQGWYFDARPDDNAEFTRLDSRFAAHPDDSRNDFYTVVLHEIGHTLGFGLDLGPHPVGLAIQTGGFLTSMGPDPWHSGEDLYSFASGSITATFTTYAGDH